MWRIIVFLSFDEPLLELSPHDDFGDKFVFVACRFRFATDLLETHLVVPGVGILLLRNPSADA